MIKSGSRVKFNIGKQVGNTTAVSGAMKELACVRVGESLNSSASEYISEAISSVRDVADARNGILSVSGSLPIEVQAESFKIFAEGVLGNVVTTTDLGVTTHTYTRSDTIPNYTIERVYDATNVQRYTGVKFNAMQLTLDNDALVTANVDVIGRDSVLQTSQINPTAEVVTGAVFAGIDCAEVKLAGVSATLISGTLNIGNNAEQVNVLGSQFAYDVVEGRGEVTLDTELFFEDRSHYDRFANEEIFEVSLKLIRGETSIEFIMPKMKYTGNRDIPVTTDKGLVVKYTARGLLDKAINGAIKIVITEPEV